MKTISELSGTVIRMAAAAVAEARRSLPAAEPPTAVPPASAAPAAGEGTGGDVPGTGGTEPRPPDAAAAPGPPPEPLPEDEAVKAALDEAVAKATGFSGDRLAMLRAAVDVAGARTGDVRLVRVFGLDERLSGAHVVGEYQYVVDLFPAAMKQVPGAQKEDRGGGHRGGGGGGGRGGRGAKGTATGGFSMDSLRDDRKKEGGGRGRPGGARRPGGGPARPPGGPPKK